VAEFSTSGRFRKARFGDVQVIGDEPLVRRLYRSNLIYREIMVDAMKDSTDLIVDTAKKIHAPHTKTGRVLRNIDGEVHVFKTRVRGHVGLKNAQAGLPRAMSARHGIYLEKGTGIYGQYGAPFLIKHPNKARGPYLHPGMRARPFLKPAFEATRAEVHEIWQNAGRKIKIALEGTR